jgi:hypothetical protein
MSQILTDDEINPADRLSAGAGEDGACRSVCGRRLGWRLVRRMTKIMRERDRVRQLPDPTLALPGTLTWEKRE